MSYRAAVLADNPLAYWRLNELASAVAADELAAHPGAYTGGVTLNQAGPPGGDRCVSLDGIDDFIDVAGMPAIAAPFSLECWVYATGNQPDKGLAGRWAAGGAMLWIDFLTNAPALVIGGAGPARYAIAPAALPLNVWNHLVGTYDGATARIYVNGAEAKATDSAGAIGAPVNNFELGRYQASNANALAGLLDEAAYYDSILAPARVLAHYNEGLAPTPDGGTKTLPSTGAGT